MNPVLGKRGSQAAEHLFSREMMILRLKRQLKALPNAHDHRSVASAPVEMNLGTETCTVVRANILDRVRRSEVHHHILKNKNTTPPLS